MRKKFSPFLLLCIAGGLAIFSSTMAKNPALPLFIRALGVPMSTVGFIAAASTVVGIVVSLPAGILSDIIGRRRVLVTAAVVFATAPFLYLLITAPWELVLVRIYHGLATAILGPVASAAIVDTFQKGRGEKLAWYSSATMIGRFLAPLAGGLLIFGDNFRWVYVADGVAGVLAFLAVVRLPLAKTVTGSAWEAIKRQRGSYGRQLAYVFSHPGILATSGIEAVQYFSYGAIETFLPIYLNEKLGYPAWKIGLLFTAQILAATLTKPIMGRLSDKYGRIPLISVGLVLGGVTNALMVMFHPYEVLIVLMAVFGLGLATVTASTSALVADMSRAEGRGGALGVLSSIMDVGQSTGPMVSGVLIAAHSYEFNYMVIGAGMIVVSLIYWFGMRRVKLPQAA